MEQLEKSRKDEHGINTSCAELAHAGVVVESCVDGIDTNGVDGKLLEVGDVALACGGICKAGWGSGTAEGRCVDAYPSCGGSEQRKERGGGRARTTKLMGSGKPEGSVAGPSVPAFWYAIP